MAREYSGGTIPRVSEQREYCKRFLAVCQTRLDQNVSRELAWASAESVALREHPLGAAELEEVWAWLREEVRTVWRRQVG
jgi:hypothetical protein